MMSGANVRTGGRQMNKRLLLLTCAFGAISSLAGHAAAAPAAATAAADQGVTEVVVTAEKREQSLQQVPVAISAFTSKERDIKGIETIQDITNFTPGLTYSTQLDRTNMRGLGRLTNQLSADSAVAVYSDDFFTTSTTEAGRDTLFVDRVEVLRGPQGTLYGRNAIGGVINIISKRPTASPYAEARATFGNYGYQNYEAAVSGPLADGLNFRLAGYYTDQEQGYFKNIYGGLPSEGNAKKEYYVEGQFSAKLGDNAEWWVKAFTQGWTDRGGPGALLATPTVGPYDTQLTDPGATGFGALPPSGTGSAFPVAFNPYFGYNTSFVASPCAVPAPGRVCGTATPGTSPFGGPVPGSVVGGVNGGINPASQNVHNFAHDQVLGIKLTDTYAINSHFIYHFPGVDFKYLTGYNTYHYHLTSDWDNSSISSYKLPLNPNGACAVGAFGPTCTNATVFPAEKFGYDEYNHWFSHEFNLTSTTNGPVQWTAGAYYFDESYTNPITVGLQQQPEVYTPWNAGLSAFGSAPNPSGNFYNTTYTMTTKSAALYGQVDWKMTDTVKLTGGLRYTSDHKQGNEYYRLISFDQTGLLETYGTFASSPFVVPSTAFDITPVVTASTSTVYKGTCSQPHQLTNGFFTRCLKDGSDAVTGTAGVEWTPDHETLAYARYSKGYKAFGFNAGTVAPQPESAPEHVDDYEIGLKKSFGRTLTLDMAAFYYNYSNAQVPVGVNNGGITLTQFFNVERAHSEGFEFEGNWSPVSRLNFALTYSFNATAIDSTCNASGLIAPGVFPANCFPDANDPGALAPGAAPKATEAASGQVLQSVKGNPLPQAPRNKVAFNANYTFEFDPGDLTLSGSYIWKDKSYAGIFQRSYDEAPSWNQVDFRATWAGKNDKYEIIGYLKNAFDSRGYEAAATGVPNGTNTSFANQSYSLAAPRLYGIEFHYKFF
jgi:iron complex outermembrane receptor protein